MVIVRCDACGSDLERKPSVAKANDYNFCDKSCAGTFYSDAYSEADEYEDEIRRLYWSEGLSVRKVASELGKPKSTIDRYMKELEIARRDRLEATGPGVGMYTSKRGYEILYANESRGSVEARVHSLVAVANGADPHQVFGSNDGVIIHHKNGVPWDNRPSNLKDMTQSDHAALHAEARS